MHWISPLFYMETKFCALKKKQLVSMETKFFRGTAGYTLLWPQKEWRNFGRAESRTSWRETKKIQIKLTTTF